MSWKRAFEKRKKRDRSNFPIPSRSDYVQTHTRLIYHSSLVLSASESFACHGSGENWEAMLICPACGKPSTLKHPEAHVYALRHPNRPLCPLVHIANTIKHSFKKQWAMYRLAGKPQAEFSVTGQGEMGSSPSLDHRKKCFQPQSWLQKNILFVGNKMFPALGFFFFLSFHCYLVGKENA